MASRKDKKRQELVRLLKAHADLGAPAGESAWEQAMWVILRRHGTKEGASRALKALQRRFVDVNECRTAKATEIADIVKRNVKNDAYRVGRQLRGFLWRYHKDLHSIELGATQDLTYAGMKKYLSDVEEYPREIALALFCHYCGEEQAFEREREAAEAGDEKAKKRGEKEFGLAIERLRLLCAVAAYGTVPAKTKQATAHRHLAKAWIFSSLPPLPRPQMPPPPKIVIEPTEVLPKGRRRKAVKKKPAPAKTAKKKAPAKKAAKKTAARKKTTKKGAGKRGGGTARPRTTRASRARTTKKSSRR